MQHKEKMGSDTAAGGRKRSFSVKQVSAEITLTKEVAWMC